MKNSFRKAGQLAAVGVAAALAGGGLFGAPAFASDDAQAQAAPVEGAEFEALAQQLLTSDANIVSVGSNGEGAIVVGTVDGKLSAATSAIASQYANINAVQRDRFQAYGTNDLVGGAGYLIDDAFVCSVGFSAWTPDGKPAVISAGHCGEVGATAARTVPTEDNAGIGQPPSETGGAVTAKWDALGTFAFSQYGGPGDGTSGHPDDTDISAIDVTNADLKLLPRVTNWATGTDDLAADSTPVTAVGTVAKGDQIERSGRSTGRQTGTVEEPDTWVNVCEDADAGVGCHSVRGFITTAYSEGGDSGGAFVKGTTAVGVLSGGNGQVSFATNLTNGLKQTGGYTIMLDLAEPVVTSPENNGHVQPGAQVTGTGPANQTLVVSVGGKATTVAIDGNGNWSFAAPNEAGTYEYALLARDGGYNKSDVVNHTVVVDEKAVKAVQITAPANGSTVDGPNVAVQGTGEPGATIVLGLNAGNGSAEAGTATVDEAGNWSIAITSPFGPATVTAVQTAGDKTSEATSSFTVALPAPVITSPENGSTLTAQPTAITGTGVAGATVKVTLDGVGLGQAIAGEKADSEGVVALATTVGEDGSWVIAIDSSLALGQHNVRAVQAIDGVSSKVTETVFTLVEAPVPTPTPTDPGNGGNGGGGGGLPATGADGGAMLGTGIFGGALVLLAGAVLLIARMRRSAAE